MTNQSSIETNIKTVNPTLTRTSTIDNIDEHEVMKKASFTPQNNTYMRTVCLPLHQFLYNVAHYMIPHYIVVRITNSFVSLILVFFEIFPLPVAADGDACSNFAIRGCVPYVQYFVVRALFSCMKKAGLVVSPAFFIYEKGGTANW